jgi:hypothetical protein
VRDPYIREKDTSGIAVVEFNHINECPAAARQPAEAPIDDNHCWRKGPLFSAKALARIVQLGPISNHVRKLIESLNARAIRDIFIRCEAPVKLAFLVDDDGPG